MKVLYYSDTFGQHTTTFIYYVVNEISKRDAEINYLAITRQNQFKYPAEYFKKLEVGPQAKLKRWINFKLEQFGLLHNFFDEKFSKSLNEEVNKFSANIIHCHFGYDAIRFFQNIDWNLVKNIPIIVHFHGHDASFHLKRKSYRDELNKIFQNKNVFPITCSNYLKDNIERYCQVSNPVKIFYYGVNLSLFTSKVKPESDKFIFLQTGSLEPKKGHIYTLKAFKAYLEKYGFPENIQLLFAGGGMLRDELQEFIDENSLTKNVRITGWLNREEILNLLSSAKVFIHPSITSKGRTEGMPNGILEAVAMNLPVISTFHAGIPEVITHKVNGYLVEEKDIDGLIEGIEFYLNNSKIDIDNKSLMEDKFDFIKNVNLLQDYYKYLISIQ